MPKTHIVVQGECMTSLAHRYGFGSFKTIYDDPDNAALRMARENPNHLMPGDRVVIPDKEGKSVSRATGKEHVFQVSSVATVLRLRVMLRRRCRYELSVAGATWRGEITGDSTIEHPIPGDAQEGELRLFLVDDPEGSPARTTWPLRLGHLDPVEETSGLQGRLRNLGFYRGAIDGVLGPLTEEAVRAFQQRSGEPVTGVVGSALRNALVDAHDRVP